MNDNFIKKIIKGIFRFSVLKKHPYHKSNLKRNFPKVGFLSYKNKAELENLLGIRIIHKEYFEQALTHRSYLPILMNPKVQSNERLEFLGDSVLGTIIADYLFCLHSNVQEGDLTKMRSWLVNKSSLAICAKQLKLDEFIKMSYSATKSLESGSESILSDTLEAIIGAIYLDNGIEMAQKFIINSLLPIIMNEDVMVDSNFKSILLETVQSEGRTSPKYEVLEESGPSHDKEFIIGVYVEEKLLGTGTGKSKKQAEQEAARQALQNLQNIVNE